jgi:hypothetical protein
MHNRGAVAGARREQHGRRGVAGQRSEGNLGRLKVPWLPGAVWQAVISSANGGWLTEHVPAGSIIFPAC